MSPNRALPANPRTGGHRDRLLLTDTSTVEYDVVGERAGRWLQVETGLDSLDAARGTIEQYQAANPTVCWHVVQRTITTTERLADDTLTTGRRPGPTR